MVTRILSILTSLLCASHAATIVVDPVEALPGQPFELVFTLETTRPAIGFSLFIDGPNEFTVSARKASVFDEEIVADVTGPIGGKDYGLLTSDLSSVETPVVALRLVMLSDADTPIGTHTFQMHHGAAVNDLFENEFIPPSEFTVNIVPEPSVFMLLIFGALICFRQNET